MLLCKQLQQYSTGHIPRVVHGDGWPERTEVGADFSERATQQTKCPPSGNSTLTRRGHQHCSIQSHLQGIHHNLGSLETAKAHTDHFGSVVEPTPRCPDPGAGANKCDRVGSSVHRLNWYQRRLHFSVPESFMAMSRKRPAGTYCLLNCGVPGVAMQGE